MPEGMVGRLYGVVPAADPFRLLYIGQTRGQNPQRRLANPRHNNLRQRFLDLSVRTLEIVICDPRFTVPGSNHQLSARETAFIWFAKEGGHELSNTVGLRLRLDRNVGPHMDAAWSYEPPHTITEWPPSPTTLERGLPEPEIVSFLIEPGRLVRVA